MFRVTNHAHLNRHSINLVDITATYHPVVAGTKPLVIPTVVVDGSNHHRQWPGVSPGIIQYSIIDLRRMEGCVGLAEWEDWEICWYDLHGESKPVRLHVSKMVSLLSYTMFKVTAINSSVNLRKRPHCCHIKLLLELV